MVPVSWRYRLPMINENEIVPYHTVDLPVEHGPWMIFAPHADDETFGMGGTIIKAVERGMEVQIVIMTDGALGGSADNLAVIRREEAMKAAGLLGCSEPIFLEHPDRGLEFNDQTVNEVAGLVESYHPRAVFFPGINELHPDHRSAALIVWEAIQSAQKSSDRQITPVSYEVLVQSPVNTLVDITPYIRRKRDVMAAYISQVEGNRYVEISGSINKLRSLTLKTEVEFAEGYYRYSQNDIGQSLQAIFEEQIRANLAYK